MIPTWARRLAYAAVLLHGALVMTNVATPDSCADVWRVDHHVSGCCANSALTRMSEQGQDCCGYGSVDERDPGAFASLPTVAAAPAVQIAALVIEAPRERLLRPRRAIPEQPPDRALRTTILLL